MNLMAFGLRLHTPLLFLLTLLLATGCASDAAGKRALVIGNSDYHNITALRNPANDARAVASSLSDLGFEVTKLTDASGSQIAGGVESLVNAIRGDETEVALFYFAGHGVQLRGDNYLVPVDLDIDTIERSENIGYNVAHLINALADAGATTNIVILDACRDNPFINQYDEDRRALNPSQSRALKRLIEESGTGLTKLNAPPNTLIAFATAPGSTAVDGVGANSPYTKQLIESMQTEGLSVEEVFKEVRRRVMAVTYDEQVPWESSSLLQRFYFKPRKIAPRGW